jgi:hypothetical protein
VQPRVVELDLGAIPPPAGSGELLLVDERSCRLVFVPAVFDTPDRHRTAVATFKRCAQVLFGYPNDEAQPGHPPYADWSYGFCEVLGSGWPARLGAQNRVAFPTQTPPGQQRHLIVVCHEGLVEALADDVSVEVFDRPFQDVALGALRQDLGDQRG